MSGQYKYIPPQPPLGFTLGIIGGFGALTGLLTAQGDVVLMPLYLVVGSLLFSVFGLALLKSGVGRGLSGWVGVLVFLAVGSGLISFPFGVLMALWGFVIGRMVLWLDSGRYRLPLPPYATSKEVLWFYTFRTICGAIFVFLITPIIILIPLSFNQEPYFSFTPGMLALDPAAFSARWYWDILQNGMVDPEAITGWWSDVWNNAQWVRSIRNSFYIGILATILSTSLGTLAAIGLASSDMPWRRPIMALLISPMIVPLVITASGLAFFFADINLVKTYWGIILAHAVLGTPFVIITVTATLSGFDKSLTRASANMGAGPIRTFFKVQMPLILPGVISGALFAFITSFDEVVAVLQLADVRQRTIPRQMFSGIREQISPTILAVATILVIISIALLTVVELLRRRSERLRGMSPS
ncbi:MAG: ABC transporter permease [Paracoccaceae bacterium]|jgi:putative spermidine/putrescine transport system permease protein|nr:ABC transporter permease [Paracoccaceae bacterium]NCW61043.1 ABC transporter permease [Paracoccaceae bacterium]NCW66008.1 ABC transporter permease [Paracoccaceae bacterium]